jgi:hypothetical protein
VDATHFRFGLKRRRRKKRKERRERETKEEEEEEEAISDSWVTTCFVWLPRGSGRECFWHCAIGGGGGGGGGNKKLACNSSSSSSKPITDKCYTRDHPTRHAAKKRREKLLCLDWKPFYVSSFCRSLVWSLEVEKKKKKKKIFFCCCFYRRPDLPITSSSSNPTPIEMWTPSPHWIASCSHMDWRKGERERERENVQKQDECCCWC